MATAAAPPPDDFADPVSDAVRLSAPQAADAALAKKLDEWFTASAPGPLPALPESVRRFVPKGEADPPLHRWHLLADGTVERWEPVERRVASIDIVTIALLAGQDRVIGWNVVRLPLPRGVRVARIVVEGGRVKNLDGFGREVEPSALTGEALRDHILSLQLAPEDDATYNGYYPTLPGNDVAHYQSGRVGFGLGFRHDMEAHQNGDPMRKANPDWSDPNEDGYLRGGTEIRGGRAEHRDKTKDMIQVDAGFQKHHDRLVAERAVTKKAAGRLKIEKTLRAGPDNPNDV